MKKCYEMRKECWIAGSIELDESPTLWTTDNDVIYILGATFKVKDRIVLMKQRRNSR
jgi:hypothetical protein